eukprot:TRINITY_DN8272_c0_g1_i1.p1 TRINITY_DN8272_c0_g1~~TRINITY_DN8272_c0_g1_i1.p1  ORF type:complete len:149 (-),score=33.76 TRINITY_DN8272_c0_g1_i1:102-548(-)
MSKKSNSLSATSSLENTGKNDMTTSELQSAESISLSQKKIKPILKSERDRDRERDRVIDRDKTVYETSGIWDRLERLKSKVDAELVKETNKSKWFNECQRNVEEHKKTSKSKQESSVEFWSLVDKKDKTDEPLPNDTVFLTSRAVDSK